MSINIPPDKHPLAMNNNSGAMGMKAGERLFHIPSQQWCVADEFLHDGDAFVTFDDGRHDTVKWSSLSKAPDATPSQPPETDRNRRARERQESEEKRRRERRKRDDDSNDLSNPANPLSPLNPVTTGVFE
jgi:hypothetical protein